MKNMKKQLIFSILFLLSIQVKSQDWLDSSFGTNGIVKTNFPLNGLDEVQKILSQPDGKIIAIGNTRNITNYYDIGICRYLENGNLDSSFGTSGTDGITVYDINNAENNVTDAFLQNDGKFIVLSSIKYSNNSTDIALTRFLNNGSVDATFGTNGTTLFGINTNPEDNETGYGLLKLTDNRILVVGIYEANITGNPAFTLACIFNADGQIDTTFGTNGYTTFNISNDNFSYADKAIQLTDGKILFCGTHFSNLSNDDNAYVAKMNLDGTLDTSFASNGIFSIDFNTPTSLYSHERAINLAVSSNGKIGIGGLTATDTYYDYLFFVLNTNGTPDLSFSTDGYLIWDRNERANTIFNVIAQNNGKWLISGDYFYLNALGSTEGKFYATQFNADGTTDMTFGDNGEMIFDIDDNYRYTQSSTMTIDNQGRILLGGFWYNNANLDFALARLLTPQLLNEEIFFNENNSALAITNPVKENIVLFNTTNNNILMNFQLYNSLGKLVFSKNEILISSNEITIPVENLQNGIYFLQTLDTNNNNKKTYKILKN